MNQNQNYNLPGNQFVEDEIDLRELFEILWSKKKLIVICTAVSTFIALIYSISLPNIYTSKALLAPAQTENMNSSFNMSRYSGLASLAGINLPSSSASSVTEAIETLSSFAFFKNSILPNIFLPDLMALQSWDAKTNTLTYDEGLYDITNNTWLKNPSDQISFDSFKGHFSVSQDVETGFVTVLIKHQSPYVAKVWLDNIISAINQTLRQDQKKRSLLSIEYLNNQIASSSYTEINQVLSSLIQQETEKLMLIEVNKDYIFKAIDPPFVAELKSEPSRTIIVLIGILIGGILGVLTALVRHYYFEK